MSTRNEADDHIVRHARMYKTTALNARRSRTQPSCPVSTSTSCLPREPTPTPMFICHCRHRRPMRMLALQPSAFLRCYPRLGHRQELLCVRPPADFLTIASDYPLIVMTLHSWDWVWNEAVLTERLASKMYDVCPPDLKKALGAYWSPCSHIVLCSS